MKITANFHKKVPVPGIEYGSQGYSCEIEIEPPPEVQQDKGKLRGYVERLFDECRARVEDQLSQLTVAGASDRLPQNGTTQCGHRPDVDSRRTRSNFRPHNGDGRGRNGHDGNGQAGGSSEASPKQLNYLRSLANADGMGYRGLANMAMSAFGKEVLHLSKAEASQLIEELKPEPRE